MGINRTGTPDTKDITLGRGKVLFASLDDTTSLPLGYRHLGNATAFTLTVNSETLEHKSSRTGIKKTDKEIILSQKAALSMKLEEINFQNLALFISGDETDVNTASPNGTVNAAKTTVAQRKLVENGRLGFWYDLVNASGVRLYDLKGTLVVKTESVGTPGTAGSTLALGATGDYDVDLKMGRIFLVSSSISTTDGHIDGKQIYFSYTTATTEADIEKVRALTKTSISGALKFIQINPVNSDKQTEYEFHRVTLKADGDFSLIGDDFTEIPLSGTAETNETAYPLSPVCDIVTHANA